MIPLRSPRARIAGAADTAEGGSGEEVTINFRYWADNTEYSQLMQDIVAKFNAENGKGITVVAEEAPWNGGAYSEDLFNVMMGGAEIDCATWKLTSTPLFVNNDLLADLTPFVDAWEDKDDIDENIYNIMKEAGGSEDAMYVMPWNIQVLYVYYRPSYFEKAGIEVPTTYEEFLEAIQKCTFDDDGDGTPEVYGFGMRGGSGGQEPWGSFIYGRGGSFEDLTSAESVAGMQDFIDLYTNHYVPPTATSDGFNEIITRDLVCLTAMTVHHTDLPPIWKQPSATTYPRSRSPRARASGPPWATPRPLSSSPARTRKPLSSGYPIWQPAKDRRCGVRAPETFRSASPYRRLTSSRTIVS